METGNVEATPELSELLQEDTPLPVVPVRLADAGTMYALPNRRVQYQTDSVGNTWTQLFPGTPKRARGVLVAATEAIYISSNGNSGMLWPEGVPYYWHHSANISVKSAVVDTPTLVGSSVELWAD